VDNSRFPIVKAELDKLLDSDSLTGAALLVFCNKQDINGAAGAASVSEHLGLTKNAGVREWKIQACSAITGKGLHEGMFPRFL
jgi:signal recognition particle receptor subunit beta